MPSRVLLHLRPSQRQNTLTPVLPGRASLSHISRYTAICTPVPPTFSFSPPSLMNLLHLANSRIRSFTQLVLATLNQANHSFRTPLIDPITQMPGHYMLLDDFSAKKRLPSAKCFLEAEPAQQKEQPTSTGAANQSEGGAKRRRPKPGPQKRRPASATASPYFAPSPAALVPALPTPPDQPSALAPSSSITLPLAPSPTAETPLLAIRCPPLPSSDSFPSTPTHAPAGLGIRFADAPFDGLGVVACRDSALSLVLAPPPPSRILLDEIYRTFAHACPSETPIASSGSDSSALRSPDASADDTDDVFVQRGSARPRALKCAKARRAAVVEDDAWDADVSGESPVFGLERSYSRPTFASLARRVRSEGEGREDIRNAARIWKY